MQEQPQPSDVHCTLEPPPPDQDSTAVPCYQRMLARIQENKHHQNLKLPRVTETEFLLTISIQYQIDK